MWLDAGAHIGTFSFMAAMACAYSIAASATHRPIPSVGGPFGPCLVFRYIEKLAMEGMAWRILLIQMLFRIHASKDLSVAVRTLGRQLVVICRKISLMSCLSVH